MPTYKVSRFEMQEYRAQVRHRRLRVAALMLSSALILATALLLLAHTGRLPV